MGFAKRAAAESIGVGQMSQDPSGGSDRRRIVRTAISRRELVKLAEDQFGDMVKAVVDVSRRVMAVGGELHADDESALLDDGSRQQDVWGINLYPGESGPDWIEFDSMINVRPSQRNRSRDVEDEGLRSSIREIVAELVHP
jgi:hypothetical protein